MEKPSIKLNLGCGKEPIPEFINLDKLNGWLWENGLTYPDRSVDAITVSHSLMYVESSYFPFIFLELFRVLKIGGVLRITEDATDDPNGARFGGHPETVSFPRECTFKNLMMFVGFQSVYSCAADETHFIDKTLCQDLHGGRPKVFFIEGFKGNE